MLTLISFLVTLGILIAVHEYGHYRVAVNGRRRSIRPSATWRSTPSRSSRAQRSWPQGRWPICCWPCCCMRW